VTVTILPSPSPSVCYVLPSSPALFVPPDTFDQDWLPGLMVGLPIAVMITIMSIVAFCVVRRNRDVIPALPPMMAYPERDGLRGALMTPDTVANDGSPNPYWPSDQ
jgi:hypothetical protein